MSDCRAFEIGDERRAGLKIGPCTMELRITALSFDEFYTHYIYVYPFVVDFSAIKI